MLKTAGTVVAGLILAALIATGGAFVTVSLLSQRADAHEEKIQDHEIRLSTAERNQLVQDLHQRVLRQESAWAQRKLDALLQESDVAVPEKPPLPPCDMEVPHR